MADIGKKIHHAVVGKGGIKDRTKVARRAKREPGR